ncbi:ABC transporter permease [Cupriavidus necator]|uniref:ABC transporter permease n=1 Tax=Cupriavidus necator TaxID=106590 RepID=UPI00339D4256
MQQFSISPFALASTLWRNRELIGTLTKREVIGRYKGSFLGLLWSLFNPLFMLLVYSFMFSVVFKSRWPGGGESKAEFALILFSGLMVFNLFSEAVNRSPSLILSNVNYVKRVVFPLEILPAVALGAVMFHFVVSFMAWLCFYVLFIGTPPMTALLFPLVLLPFVFVVLGVTWFLAAIGVYLRDVSQVIGIITTALMFLTPVFYPASSLPPDYRLLITLNPITPVVETARNVLIWGKLPDLYPALLYSAFSLLVAWFGFAWFQKTRKGFADVL